jgi:hypothetical protein
MGKGFFHTIYGTKQGLAQVLILIDNANAIVRFQAKEVSFNGTYAFLPSNSAEFHVEIDYGFFTECRIIQTTTTRPTTIGTKMSSVSLKIKSLIAGFQQTLYPGIDNDGTPSGLFVPGINLYPKNVLIDIKNLNHCIHGGGNELILGNSPSLPIGYVAATIPHKYMTNLTYTFLVENYVQFFRSVGGTTATIGSSKLVGTTRQDSASTISTNSSSNNRVFIYIRNGEWLTPFWINNAGENFEGVNNLIHIKADKWRKVNPGTATGLLTFVYHQGQNPLDRNNMIVEGWFEDSGPGLYMMYGAETGSGTGFGTSKIILKGKFVARYPGKHVMYRLGVALNKISFVLDRAQMYNDGSITVINSASPTPEIPCMGAIVNTGDANTRSRGEGITIDSRASDLFY